MNYQYYKNMEVLKKLFRRLNFSGRTFKTIIVTHEVDNDNSVNNNEWNGYVQTVKTFIK